MERKITCLNIFTVIQGFGGVLEKHLHHCGFSFAKYVLKAHFQVNFIHHVEERHTWVHKLGSKNQWWQIVGQTAWILKSSSRLFALTNFANFSVRPNISGHNFGIGDQQNFRFKQIFMVHFCYVYIHFLYFLLSCYCCLLFWFYFYSWIFYFYYIHVYMYLAFYFYCYFCFCSTILIFMQIASQKSKLCSFPENFFHQIWKEKNIAVPFWDISRMN